MDPSLDEVLRALTALSAPECRTCRKTLAPGKNACCNNVYCPFCRTLVSEQKCRHLVAYRAYGRWTVPSVIATIATVETLPVEPAALVEWSEAQKRRALGPAYDVTHRIWGEGLAIAPARWKVRECLVHAVPGTVTAEFNSGDRNTICAFHADPVAFVAQERALIAAWKKGLETLRNTTPEAHRRLLCVRPLEPFGGDRWAFDSCWRALHRATFLTFSPDGSTLAVGLENRVEMRAVPSGDLLWSQPVTGEMPRSATFAAGGATLAVMTSALYGKTWRTLLFDATTGDQRAVLPPSYTTCHQSVGSPSVACLHDSRLLVDVEGRNVRLTTLDGAGGIASTELLTHRVPIKCFGASPDGVTFATVAQNSLLLWRVPAPEEGRLP